MFLAVLSGLVVVWPLSKCIYRFLFIYFVLCTIFQQYQKLVNIMQKQNIFDLLKVNRGSGTVVILVNVANVWVDNINILSIA